MKATQFLALAFLCSRLSLASPCEECELDDDEFIDEHN